MSFFGGGGALKLINLGIADSTLEQVNKNTNGVPVVYMLTGTLRVTGINSMGIGVLLYDENDTEIFEIPWLFADGSLSIFGASNPITFIIPPNWSYRVTDLGGTGTYVGDNGAAFGFS